MSSDQTSRPSAPELPRGWKRWLWRTPIWLYRLHLGWLLGRRFLLLTHIGRKSGLPRHAVVEIDDYDPDTNTYLIASGFGKTSDWYRNLLKTPEVTIQVGNREMAAVAEPLAPEASGEAMVQYARRNPRAARNLTRVLGYPIDGSEAGYRALGRDVVPFVALHVQETAGRT